MDQPTCHIDGFGPLSVARPASVGELGEIVRRAAADGAALYPVGGGTQLGLGNTPIKVTWPSICGACAASSISRPAI